jgi:hypothetical protein
MSIKHVASAQKFKKLYFYKFLFIQIWYAFCFAVLVSMVWLLPLIKGSFIVCPIFILIGISAVAWFYSLGWYFDKKYTSEHSIIILKNVGMIYRKEKRAMNSKRFAPRSNVYIYNISDISDVSISKYRITVYGDIAMRKYNKIYPDELLAIKYFSHMKIPNYYEKQCVDGMQELIMEKP